MILNADSTKCLNLLSQVNEVGVSFKLSNGKRDIVYLGKQFAESEPGLQGCTLPSLPVPSCDFCHEWRGALKFTTTAINN